SSLSLTRSTTVPQWTLTVMPSTSWSNAVVSGSFVRHAPLVLYRRRDSLVASQANSGDEERKRLNYAEKTHDPGAARNRMDYYQSDSGAADGGRRDCRSCWRQTIPARTLRTYHPQQRIRNGCILISGSRSESARNSCAPARFARIRDKRGPGTVNSTGGMERAPLQLSRNVGFCRDIFAIFCNRRHCRRCALPA